MQMAILVSNTALVIVTMVLAGIDWHHDNALVNIISMLRPRGKAYRVARCQLCRKTHKHNSKVHERRDND